MLHPFDADTVCLEILSEDFEQIMRPTKNRYHQNKLLLN